MLSEKPWRPELVLRLLAGIFVGISLGAILAQGVKAVIPESSLTKMLLFVIGTMSFHGVALLLIHQFLRDHQIGWTDAFGLNRPGLHRAICLAMVAAALVLPIALFLSQISIEAMEMIDMKVEIQPAVQALRESVTKGQRVYFGLVAIFVAPVAEELVFRGILYPFLRSIQFRRSAIWITSVLFALSHANAMTFVPLTFIGIVLTFLYESTENLFTPIVTHALFNAANFLWLMNDLS
jgi:membrane protease YdiL (CAAX protease family)